MAASAFVSVSLIQIRSNVTQQMKEVAALESQINDMKADNDARYKQITTSVDLNAIKDAAINRLGMKYASQDQIVYYSVDKNNYMDQYSEDVYKRQGIHQWKHCGVYCPDKQQFIVIKMKTAAEFLPVFR